MLKHTKSVVKPSFAKSWKRAAAGIATAAVALSIASVSAQGDPNVPPPHDPQIPGLMQGGRGPGGPFGGGPLGGGPLGGGPFGGPGGRADGRRGGRFGDLALVRFVADELGLEPADIVAQLRTENTTLAAIVTEAGGDASAVLQAAIDAAGERINRALENGRIDQAQADALLAQIAERLTQQFNTSPLEQRVGQVGRGVVLLAAANSLDMTMRDLLDDLRGGSTLSQILSDGGVDVAAFTGDVIARLQARLNVQVVDGDLTQEQADQLLAGFQAELETILNQTWDGPLAVPPQGI